MVENVHDRVSRLEDRVDRIEDWRQTAVTSAALAAQTEQMHKARFDRIDNELAEIKQAAWRIVWVVAGSFSVSLVAWVVNGGLKIG
jgi:hypothetical protein